MPQTGIDAKVLSFRTDEHHRRTLNDLSLALYQTGRLGSVPRPSTVLRLLIDAAELRLKRDGTAYVKELLKHLHRL